MASFDDLKAKYQSVLKVAQEKHVQIANVHMENNKLLIRGSAPTVEAANAVWDEIKRINPKVDDITADFPVNATAGNTAAAGAKPTAVKTYTVKAGDTLSKISKQFYGSPNDYMKIFNANRDKLKDPDKIDVGQELKIPAA